uniref:Uncharacterized protein n=1 Tax=Solanum lycopersicum TaxID=4081 RepID=A0A3Q7GFD2_SOLLC
KTVARYFT